MIIKSSLPIHTATSSFLPYFLFLFCSWVCFSCPVWVWMDETTKAIIFSYQVESISLLHAALHWPAHHIKYNSTNLSRKQLNHHHVIPSSSKFSYLSQPQVRRRRRRKRRARPSRKKWRWHCHAHTVSSRLCCLWRMHPGWTHLVQLNFNCSFLLNPPPNSHQDITLICRKLRPKIQINASKE